MLALPNCSPELALPLAVGGPALGVLILILCVAAGIGTVLLLPGRREKAIRKIGGTLVLATGLIAMAMIARLAAVQTSGDVYFWIFSAVAVLGSFRVISHSNPVYSAMYFVLTVLASAGLFVLLWAEFMAAALVLIYAGAILVTYVFVIMLASQAQAGKDGAVGGAECDQVSREPLAAAAIGFALMGVMLFVIFDKAKDVTGKERPAVVSLQAGQDAPNVSELARYLFTDQLLNVELAGVILTLAMVGAIAIARKRLSPQTSVAGPVLPSEVTEDDPHAIPVYGTKNPRAGEGSGQ